MSGKTEKQRLIEELHEYAMREIPGGADPWPQVRDHIMPAQIRQRSQKASITHLGWTTMAMVILLAAGAAYLAILTLRPATGVEETHPTPQGQLATDVEHIEEMGLVQKIDLSQTVNGYTVTLVWAYADGNRAVVFYSFDKPEDSRGWNILPEIDSLTTHDGKELPWLGASIRGELDKVEGIVESFDTTELAGTPSTLDLRLTVTLAARKPISQTPEADPVEESRPEPVAGPFTFEFSVPFTPAQVVEVNQSVETSSAIITDTERSLPLGRGTPGPWENKDLPRETVSTTLTLERVRIAPSQTVAFFRFDSVPNERTDEETFHLSEWFITAVLDVEGTTYKDTSFSRHTDRFRLALEERGTCTWDYFLYDKPGEWTITVERLRGLLREPDPSKERSATESYYITTGDLYVNGPWVFRLQVPAAVK
jgi:hypothetical protein